MLQVRDAQASTHTGIAPTGNVRLDAPTKCIKGGRSRAVRNKLAIRIPRLLSINPLHVSYLRVRDKITQELELEAVLSEVVGGGMGITCFAFPAD